MWTYEPRMTFLSCVCVCVHMSKSNNAISYANVAINLDFSEQSNQIYHYYKLIRLNFVPLKFWDLY